MAAIEGIAKGKGLTEIVGVQPWGMRARIGEALHEARASLRDAFVADHTDFVDLAFYKFGAKRPSDDIRECVTALLELAQRREPRDPFESAPAFQRTLLDRYVRTKDGRAFQYKARYTTEYPRTYEARIWFGDDHPQGEFNGGRDHLRGPLVDIGMSEESLSGLVRYAVEEKIESSDVR
jgi:hypothetical protein